MSFDYFYGEQSDQFAFYRTPKVFYTDEKFRGLSSDAKTLYGIMLDRVSLSSRNGWHDKAGRVYIYMTLDSIGAALGCAHQKATGLLVELEKFGLIERRKQGQGKPAMIYVKNFIVDNFSDCRKSSSKSDENQQSKVMEFSGQDFSKSATNNTEINNTECSYTNPILSEEEEERRSVAAYFDETLQIDWLKKAHPYNDHIIDEIYELIIDTVCSKRQIIRIAGDDKPASVVKSRFMKLDSSHIELVLDGMKENNTRVRNMKQYLLAALYNAPLTISNYYQSLVNHDMATGLI